MTARDLHLDLIESVINVRLLNRSIGSLLKQLRYKEGYKDAVGLGIDSWNDYLSQPEIGFTIGEANLLIKIHDMASEVSTEDFAEIPVATLKIMVRKDLFDEDSISSAKELTTKDFKEVHQDRVSDSNGVRTYTYLLMKRCNETGTLSKVKDVLPTDNVLKPEEEYGH